MKSFCAATIVTLVAISLVVNYLHFSVEQSKLDNEASQAYFSLGKDVAQKILSSARPWMLAQPMDARLQNHAIDYGELRNRVETISNQVVLENYNSPMTTIRAVVERFGSCIHRCSKMNPPVRNEMFEVAMENKEFAHCVTLEVALNKLESLLYSGFHSKNAAELKQKRAELEKAKSDLENILATKVERCPPQKDYPALPET